MHIGVGWASLCAVPASVSAGIFNTWIGLKSMKSSFSDLRHLARSEDRAFDNAAGSVAGDFTALAVLDALGAFALVGAIVAVQPASWQGFLAGDQGWIGWLVVGLVAPTFASRAFVGRTLARLFGRLFDQPLSDGDQWAAEAWRVRDTVRQGLLDRVYPLADSRARELEDHLRLLEVPLKAGYIDAFRFVDGMHRYVNRTRMKASDAVGTALQVSMVGMTTEQAVKHAVLLLHVFLNHGIIAPLLSYRKYIE